MILAASADAATIENEDVAAGSASILNVSRPVRVRVANQLAVGGAGETNAVRRSCLQIALESLPVRWTRIGGKLAERSHSHGEVWSSANHQVHHDADHAAVLHALHGLVVLAATVAYALDQLQSGVLRCLHSLSLLHAKLGQDRMQKLGLPHWYVPRLAITLDFHAKAVLELAEIGHLEALDQRSLGRREQIHVVAREDEVVDIENHEDHGLVASLDVHAVVRLTLGESDLAHELVDGLVPHARRLLETVQRALELAHVAWGRRICRAASCRSPPRSDR